MVSLNAEPMLFVSLSATTLPPVSHSLTVLFSLDETLSLGRHIQVGTSTSKSSVSKVTER